MKLLDQIKNFKPFNDQEAKDQEQILFLIQQHDDIFTRDNALAHMTASAWVVNKDRDKVLMIYHNIYDSWSWLGGHADGQTDLMAVAIKEVQEESGITNVQPLSDDIFSMEILTVDGHERRGDYVISHLHLNVTYLLEADENEATCVKPDENSGVGWFELEKAVAASTEPWFQDRIYSKLNEKLKDHR